MKRSRIWFMLLSILAGGFLFVSFFLEIPQVRTISAHFLLWAERMFAILLFFAIADTMILQVRKSGNDGGMRLIRTISFAAFLAVLILGLVNGSDEKEFNRSLFMIQQTVESGLAGIVCLSLIFAMYRLPGQAPAAMKSGFFAGLLIFLVIYGGLRQMVSLPAVADRILSVLESIPQGTLTGLLIGIAIGAAVSGVRFIISGRLAAKEDK